MSLAATIVKQPNLLAQLHFYLGKGGNYRTHLLELLWELNNISHVKSSGAGLAQNELSIQVILLMKIIYLQILQSMYLRVAKYCCVPMKKAEDLL